MFSGAGQYGRKKVIFRGSPPLRPDEVVWLDLYPEKAPVLIRMIREIGEAFKKTGVPVREESIRFGLVEIVKKLVSIMARDGFPQRYSHWSWSKKAAQIEKNLAKNPHKLLEVVAPGKNNLAYLIQAQETYKWKAAIIYALAKSDLYQNNIHFAYTREGDWDEWIKTNRERVQFYESQYGEEAVETTLDSAHAIRNLIDYQAINPVMLEESVSQTDLKNDVMGYILKEGKGLKDWQRTLLNMVREESYILAPVEKTKIMANGWAFYWSIRLGDQLGGVIKPEDTFSKWREEDWQDQQLGSGDPLEYNSYELGAYLWRHAENALRKKYKDLPREEQDKNVLNGLLEIRKTHDDVSFIKKYFTDGIAQALNLVNYAPVNDHMDAQKEKVLFKENLMPGILKKRLIETRENAGHPVIRVISGNANDKRELVLQHEFKYFLNWTDAEATVIKLAQMWGGKVHLQTLYQEKSNRGKPTPMCLESNGYTTDSVRHMFDPQSNCFKEFVVSHRRKKPFEEMTVKEVEEMTMDEVNRLSPSDKLRYRDLL